MKRLLNITLILAFTLSAGCGGELPLPAELTHTGQELELAPMVVLELDLPGCEEAQPPLAGSLTPSWRLALHPFDPELVVLSRDSAPFCITSTTAASGLLQGITALEAPSPTVLPRTRQSTQDERDPEKSSEEQLSEESSAGPEQHDLPVQRISSMNVKDDPIPVPRTSKLSPKSGS